jgi:hypothetical protein
MAEKTEIKNARITATMLGQEDRGIMSAYLTLDGGGWGVSFGGYAMDSWSEAEQRRIGAAYGMEFIMGILRVVGVESWEALKGKHIRVETEGLGGRCLRIGNILKDEWFDPKALAEQMEAKK